MTDAPDSAPTPPDSPALRAAQQALDAALADPAPDPTDPGAQEPTAADAEADLAARARRLENAHQALAALLDEEPPVSSSSDDAEA